MFKRAVLSVILLGLMAGSAEAGPVFVGVDPRNTIPGVVANGIVVDGAGVDWTAAVLVVDISGSAGFVHNGSPDSNRPQEAFWGFFPELQWDTYIGIPGGVNDVGPLPAGDLGSPLLSLGGPSLGGPAGPLQLVSVTWGNTDTGDTGQTLIANISLSSDAFGSWQLLASFAGGVVVQDAGVVTQGAMRLASLPPPYPEPASFALFALAGPILLFRR